MHEEFTIFITILLIGQKLKTLSHWKLYKFISLKILILPNYYTILWELSHLIAKYTKSII